VVVAIVLWGILTLVLQNYKGRLWLQTKNKISCLLSVLGVILFVSSNQPYAAIFLFVFLLIKAFFLIYKK
jgi:hypothetical protein